MPEVKGFHWFETGLVEAQRGAAVDYIDSDQFGWDLRKE